MQDTLLMIHGMWTGGWIWDNFKSFFNQKGYRCITPTLRYHNLDPTGPPDSALGTTSLLDYTDDLSKEISNLKEIPVIMGHSMGGLLAQILGSRGLAKALILLAPSAPSGLFRHQPESHIKGFQSIVSRRLWWKEPVRPNFKEAVYLSLHLLPYSEQKAVYDRWGYESGLAVREIGSWFSDRKRASAVDETKVTCPVLLVAGSEDRATPSWYVKKIAEKYKPVSTYMEFPNHAHWLIGEPGWQEIAGQIFDWLNSALPQSC